MQRQACRGMGREMEVCDVRWRYAKRDGGMGREMEVWDERCRHETRNGGTGREAQTRGCRHGGGERGGVLLLSVGGCCLNVELPLLLLSTPAPWNGVELK